jgi:hypothetical protein
LTTLGIAKAWVGLFWVDWSTSIGLIGVSFAGMIALAQFGQGIGGLQSFSTLHWGLDVPICGVSCGLNDGMSTDRPSGFSSPFHCALTQYYSCRSKILLKVGDLEAPFSVEFASETARNSQSNAVFLQVQL